MYDFLVDSHCHLNYPGLHEKLEQVIEDAEKAGVKVFQTICTQMSELDSIRAIAHSRGNIFYSVGVHPLHVFENELVGTDKLVAIIQGDQKISGIGETGLDYYKVSDAALFQQQKESFKNHIAAAQITKLPVIVHTREAEEDTYQIICEMMGKERFSGVLHCFTGSIELAMKAIELGFYISASGIITFKNADAIREVFKALPADRILVETDSPFLAPTLYRGQTNQPAYVVEVAKTLAHLKNMNYDSVVQTTTGNFFKLFGGSH